MNRSKYLSGYRRPVLPEPVKYVVGDRVVYRKDIWNGFDWRGYAAPSYRTMGVVTSIKGSQLYIRWDERIYGLPVYGMNNYSENYVSPEDIEKA